ncbi:MAG TPA: response regulator transcription factor [Lachnospiraceae bacterium]
MKKILIVEDDTDIAKSIKKELESWNYRVVIATAFDNIVEEVLSYNPHMVLLDIMLPIKNGYYWCEQIRKVSDLPVIFISSKSQSMDIVMAMQFGGDDYIVKPIDLAVLSAKVSALMRRSYDLAGPGNSLIWKDCYLYADEAKLEVKGQFIELTKTELSILTTLFRGGGKFVSRERIMEKCWSGDDFIDDNTLAVNIARLRKKLAEIGVGDLIVTKKGMGYGLQ